MRELRVAVEATYLHVSARYHAWSADRHEKALVRIRARVEHFRDKGY